MALRLPYFLCAQASLLLATCQLAHGSSSLSGNNLKLIYQWRYIDFKWPNEKAREEAIQHGEYVRLNALPTDVTVYKDRIFVTTPRFMAGIPASLSTISDETKNGQHLLKPFPNWALNREGSCDGLYSVIRTSADDFGRLWALDSGVTDFLTGQPKRICQPQIVVFDLNAGDKIIGRYPIPDSVLDCKSLLLSIQVDIRNGRPDDVVVYISDVFGYHIIVFDLRHKTFWRVTQNSFLPDPHYADYYIAGTRIQTTDGIYSLSLGPICNNDRRVYYHVLTSLEECWVAASTLRDQAYETNERAYPDSYYCYSKLRTSQISTETITDDGIMFSALEAQNGISCWNTEIDYNMENTAIVARNDTTLQAIRSLTLSGRDLYTLSTRIQLYAFGLQKDNEINFRLFRANVDELIRGTPCEKPCPGDKSDWISHPRN